MSKPTPPNNPLPPPPPPPQVRYKPGSSSFDESDLEIAAVWTAICTGQSPLKDLPPAQRRGTIQDLSVAFGGVQPMIEAFEWARDRLDDPACMPVGLQCPREDIQCSSIDLDSPHGLTIFYHPLQPGPPPPPDTPRQHIWVFYIAPAGAEPSECVDYQKEGIGISILGPDGRWGGTMGLMVPEGCHVRVEYPYPFGGGRGGEGGKGKGKRKEEKEERRTQEIVFPQMDPPFPVLYLGAGIGATAGVKLEY